MLLVVIFRFWQTGMRRGGKRRGYSRALPKHWGVRADGKLDVDQSLRGRRLIVLLESSAYFSSLDSNHRIVAGGVVMGALEDFNADGTLFQLFGRLVKLVLDNVAEELPATSGAPEEATFQDVVKLVQDLLLFLIGQGEWVRRRTLIVC